MRHAGFFVLGSLVTGLAAFVGCSSGSGGGTGAGTTTTTHTTSGSTSSTGTASTTSGSTTTTGAGGSTTSSTSGSTSTSGGTGGTTGTGGSGPSAPACSIPNPIPSKGSCVTYVGVDGGEADAGVDDAGNASLTNCDPVTNAGCTGTDVCGIDGSGNYYFCQGPGSPGNVAICGDCTAQNATCGAGGLCFSFDGTNYACTQMCCSNADCGAGGSCNNMLLGTPLPNGVGLCVK